MNLTAEQLEEYFEDYGWTYSRESEDTWITGVRTNVSAFRIMVRLTEHWIFFVINPFVVAPPRAEDRLRVYYHTLRYNLDMNFAKLGLDSDGDIFIAVELPTENFVYSHFSDALDGLSHHASMIYAELFGLAHMPDNTEGRYDDELEDESLDDSEAMESLLSLLRQDEENKDDEVFIGGRRLKIFDDEQGSTRVELEDSDDTPDSDDNNGANSSPPTE